MVIFTNFFLALHFKTTIIKTASYRTKNCPNSHINFSTNYSVLDTVAYEIVDFYDKFALQYPILIQLSDLKTYIKLNSLFIFHNYCDQIPHTNKLISIGRSTIPQNTLKRLYTKIPWTEKKSNTEMLGKNDLEQLIKKSFHSQEIRGWVVWISLLCKDSS